jgi:CBS domain-containing protein
VNISDILRHKSYADGPAVVTIAPTATVAELVHSLGEHNIGAIVALEGDRVAGIVSERDVVRRLATDGAAVLDLPVGDLMTTTVHACSGTDAVDAIAATMTDRRIRHMPVIDGDELVGLVSIGDVVAGHIRQLEQDRGRLEEYIAG